MGPSALLIEAVAAGYALLHEALAGIAKGWRDHLHHNRNGATDE